MTLLDSFSKPRWQHKDPEVRKSAINELDDEAVLLELVHGDPEPAVRAHALSRVTASATLENLCETLSPPLLAQARAQRLSQLLPDADRLSTITDDAALVKIAGLSDDPDQVAAAIGQVKELQTRMELAASHPVAKVRISAVQGIEDVGLLKELMQQSKNKDKSVFRYCKERVDRQHALEKEAAERQKNILRLAEDARKLSGSVDSPEFKARYQTLEHRWSQLMEYAEPEHQQQIKDDLEICAKRVEKLVQAHEAEEDRIARIEAAGKTFREVISELKNIKLADLALTEPKAVKAFIKDLDGLEGRWLTALHDAQPAANQTSECKQHLNHWREIAQASKRVMNKEPALTKLHEDAAKLDKSDYMAHQKLMNKIDKQIGKLPWPESEKAATPAPIQKLHELRDGLHVHLEELKKHEKTTLVQLEEAFAQLRKELDDNHFKNADRVHNRIRNLLKHLSHERQNHYYDELRPLTARLREIHDWQGFAIEPKKVELCEQMAALIGSTEDPDVLATRIKTLQDEWKTLGPLAPRRDQALWKKFHAAAEEAYAPCKEAFKQQAEVRKQNLRQRMELVSQLTDYDQRMTWPGAQEFETEASAPDWKLVQKTLDTARAAFNAIGPVSANGERRSRKALQTICDKIYGHIKDEYERNIEKKKALVAAAQACVELEDLKEAINKAKGLQRDWNQVGLTPRQVDRKLWKEFRSACDGVFGRLDDSRKEQDAARNERAAAAKERAEQAKARALKEQQRWPNLLDKMKACAMKAEDEKKAVKLWEKEADIPKGIDSAALEAWWEQGPDQKLTEEQLRQACIAVEVLVGAESPPEDKQARMAYQMQRLVEGMGGGAVNQEEQLLEQINGFITMRPAGAWVDRFCCGGKIIPQKT